MSHPSTPTTKNTTGLNYKEATSKTEDKPANKLTTFLNKECLETMEEYYGFKAYQERYDRGSRNACFVTPDVFDLVTKGDTKSPLFWAGDVPVIDFTRKDAALEVLGSKKSIATVTIG